MVGAAGRVEQRAEVVAAAVLVAHAQKQPPPSLATYSHLNIRNIENRWNSIADSRPDIEQNSLADIQDIVALPEWRAVPEQFDIDIDMNWSPTVAVVAKELKKKESISK